MVTFLFLGDQLKQFPKPLEAGDRANRVRYKTTWETVGSWKLEIERTLRKKGWIFYPTSNLDEWLVIWVNVPQK